MLALYEDILYRITEKPTWFDSNGTPRYGSFTPALAPNIYATEVVLYEIACQACDERFLVEEHSDHYERYVANEKLLKDRIADGTLHFGDPPRHGGCVGETMNCIDLRVLEYWVLSPMPDYGWRQVKEMEISLDGETQ